MDPGSESGDENRIDSPGVPSVGGSGWDNKFSEASEPDSSVAPDIGSSPFDSLCNRLLPIPSQIYFNFMESFKALDNYVEWP